MQKLATELLQEQYGFIFEPELLEEVAAYGNFMALKCGKMLIEPGQEVGSIPLLLDGSIKVMREDAEGRELLLYYLEKGDTCAMSFSCCMSSRKSKVKAIIEEDAQFIMVPVAYLEKWLTKFPTWKSFVFDTFNGRIDELIETVDSMAFMKLDDRLYKYLTNKAKVIGQTEIPATHQMIADDLNTSRVVISRLLKQLEKKGDIRLGRNRIEILRF